MNALAFLLATAVALALTHVVMSALRRLGDDDVPLLALVVVVAGIVAAIELAMRAWFPAAHTEFGRFVPLIAAACLLVRRRAPVPTR